VLCSWLSNSPNYEEITKWYLGWKNSFSDTLLAQLLIKDKFNEALDIMNRAVASGVGRWTNPGRGFKPTQPLYTSASVERCRRRNIKM
jgi:tuftelin-interacting protein 11